MVSLMLSSPDGKHHFNIREDSSPIVSDGALIRETWIENVYQLPEDLTGKTVLDIGANIGVVSVWAAARGAHVYAVEPEPDNQRLLHENLAINGVDRQVDVFGCAVGHHDHTAYINPRRGNAQIVQAPGDGTTEVSVVSLKTLMDWIGIPEFDIMKIDIEGSEYPLFAGADLDTIARAKYITLEFDAGTDEQFGAMITKIVKRFNTHAFGSPERGGYIHAWRY